MNMDSAHKNGGSSGMLMGRLPTFWGFFWNADDADLADYHEINHFNG
jgi:hypothetical protein